MKVIITRNIPHLNLKEGDTLVTDIELDVDCAPSYLEGRYAEIWEDKKIILDIDGSIAIPICRHGVPALNWLFPDEDFVNY